MIHEPNRIETILVVEDEAAVRQLIRVSLTRAGYRVLEAGNGREAMALCDERGATIDAVLTDIRLPVVGGHELILYLRERQPNVGIVAMSGYPLDPPLADVPLLEKPFSRRSLLEALRTVLDSR
jgi:CheY-like chemotaxis protein